MADRKAETENMPYIRLFMYRKDLDRIPEAALPADYSIRSFRAGDDEAWAAIEQAAGEFASKETAKRHFATEFGAHLEQMERRCLLLLDEAGTPVGTSTAWYGERGGRTVGRIHWVAIMPEHQGKGLAKPLLAESLRTLSRFHAQAYLSTQTTSYRAVNLYLNYGFQPDVRTEACYEGWAMMERVLQRKISLDARRPEL